MTLAMTAIVAATALTTMSKGSNTRLGSNHLDTFSEHADQSAHHDGEQGGHRDSTPLDRALRKRLVDEEGEHAVLEEVAAFGAPKAGEGHEVGGGHTQRDADLGAAGTGPSAPASDWPHRS